MVLKITNLHILRYLPTYWLYLLERYTIDNQRCTHTFQLKLNNMYELLDKQAVNDKVVKIRHFSIIDEAHYMLDFDNRTLHNLIAVGRNKGLRIILATQNMSSFKSKGFDFYANAQYPLIMKQ